MQDPRLVRNVRLENEYEELMKLNALGNMINITPLGNRPYAKYRVEFNIRTIVSPTPQYRDRTVCTLTIPATYPADPPILTADDRPYPWHINWFQSGRWCYGSWSLGENVVSYLLRAARILQFDPVLTNPKSVANQGAVPFWEANKNNKRIIPCDTQPLPLAEDIKKIRVLPQEAKPAIRVLPKQDKLRINIKNRNDGQN